MLRVRYGTGRNVFGIFFGPAPTKEPGETVRLITLYLPVKSPARLCFDSGERTACARKDVRVSKPGKIKTKRRTNSTSIDRSLTPPPPPPLHYPGETTRTVSAFRSAGKTAAATSSYVIVPRVKRFHAPVIGRRWRFIRRKFSRSFTKGGGEVLYVVHTDPGRFAAPRDR